jgi:hypothetical protein
MTGWQVLFSDPGQVIHRQILMLNLNQDVKPTREAYVLMLTFAIES